MQMIIPKKPYLIRALYEWIVDNNWVPHIVVNTHFPGVEIPPQFIEDAGKMVFNISPTATAELVIDNDVLEFNARFSGIAHHIYVPIPAILAIYARENGQGMIFSEEENAPPAPPAPPAAKKTTTLAAARLKKNGKPKLTIVKNDKK